MPQSDHWAVPWVVEVIDHLRPDSIFDFGVGNGQSVDAPVPVATDGAAPAPPQPAAAEASAPTAPQPERRRGFWGRVFGR